MDVSREDQHATSSRYFGEMNPFTNTINIVQDAEIGTYYQMWNFMASNPEVFTTSNSVGIERVKESKGGKQI